MNGSRRHPKSNFHDADADGVIATCMPPARPDEDARTPVARAAKP